MHTIMVIAGGFVLLGLCALIGRAIGCAAAPLYFLPLWLAAAGVNMWIGVNRAGYTAAQELPIFLMVFAVPATAAMLLWWLASRG